MGRFKKISLKHVLVIFRLKTISSQCKFVNPICPPESADPFVCYKDEYYYFCVTTGNNVTIHKSKRLEEVAEAPGVVVWTVGNEVKSDVWAPEIHYINGKWYIYASGNPVGGA